MALVTAFRTKLLTSGATVPVTVAFDEDRDEEEEDDSELL